MCFFKKQMDIKKFKTLAEKSEFDFRKVYFEKRKIRIFGFTRYEVFATVPSKESHVFCLRAQAWSFRSFENSKQECIDQFIMIMEAEHKSKERKEEDLLSHIEFTDYLPEPNED